METVVNSVHREPWNRGKIVGQKAPFKVKDAENLVTLVCASLQGGNHQFARQGIGHWGSEIA